MITWSSKGNYRKQPTCGSKRHEGTGSSLSLAHSSHSDRECIVFRADGTEAAPAHRHGGAAGSATATPARLWSSCRPPDTSHPKGIPYGAAASIPGSAHSQILPHPSEAGKHHPLPQQESSIRAAGTAPWSRRLKQPGAPAHTLNWGPLSPDTKCCA